MKSDYKQIRKRMKENLNNDSSKIEGTFSMDIINAFSNELARIIDMEVDTIIDDVMLDTASGFRLDRKGLELGEERNEGQKARGVVKIIGNSGVVITKGTLLKSIYDVYYEASQDVVLSAEGEALLTIICTEVGSFGNVKANEIVSFKDNLNGISRVFNEGEINGGTNRETDEEFRNRLIEKKRKPITSGNKNHYNYWAKQVSGVLKAKTIALANGAGTVKVIVLSNEYGEVDSAVLKNVRDHIEENRPIGASVEVVSATPKIVSLSINLELDEGYEKEAIKARIEKKINDYLKEIVFDETKPLSYYKVGDIIFSIDGVKDILDYKLNNQKESLKIGIGEFFKLSEVQVNVS